MIFFMVPLFAMWGSFLNMLGYRLVHDNIPLSEKRSCCPNCKQAIAPYDLIPIISWIALKTKCRNCKTSISWLYPFIEIITIITLSLLWYQYNISQLFFVYALFFSALIVTIRTDLDCMLISQYATYGLVPIGLLFSYYQIVPISFFESVSATMIGYSILWIINILYKTFKKTDGIGAGDFDLLALIGSWTGFLGLWTTITIGSFVGSIVGLILIISGHDTRIKIPFGPFLALGTIVFVLFQNYIVSFLI